MAERSDAPVGSAGFGPDARSLLARLDGPLPADRLAARTAIVDLTSRYALCLDSRDGAGLARLFTDPVSIDLSSINGSVPATLPIDDYLAMMVRNMGVFDGTQHAFSNHLVSFGDERPEEVAHCLFYGSAHHILPGPDGPDILVMGVRYTATAVCPDPRQGWRIAALRIERLWASGAWHRLRRPGDGGSMPEDE